MLYTSAFFALRSLMVEEQRKNKKSEPEDWLGEAILLTKYFDSYAPLFDPKQRVIFEDYICNDMSLSEIAEREGMSRQGVSDLIRRISRKLKEYENRLHLSDRSERAEAAIAELRSELSNTMLTEDERNGILRHLDAIAELLA